MNGWISEFYQEYRFQLWLAGCTSCKQLEEIIYNEHPSKQNTELIVASDPGYAYIYARNIIRGPWPLGEKAIVFDSFWAYKYAFNIIKGPWPPGEKAIASDPCYAYWYARNIINGPWPPGEKVIASNPMCAYLYAKYIIKNPWPMGEKTIASDPYWKAGYEYHLKTKIIVSDPY